MPNMWPGLGDDASDAPQKGRIDLLLFPRIEAGLHACDGLAEGVRCVKAVEQRQRFLPHVVRREASQRPVVYGERITRGVASVEEGEKV